MYKIAVASSDGKNIDVSFGGAVFFDIYKVSGKEYCLDEKREVPASGTGSKVSQDGSCGSIGNAFGSNAKCGGEKSAGGGCGTGRGCGGNEGAADKVEIVSDCRCIVCKKIGFQATKQLEKKAIIGFDVECSIEEALIKIINYFDKVDSHQSLRGLAKEL